MSSPTHLYRNFDADGRLPKGRRAAEEGAMSVTEKEQPHDQSHRAGKRPNFA